MMRPIPPAGHPDPGRDGRARARGAVAVLTPLSHTRKEETIADFNDRDSTSTTGSRGGTDANRDWSSDRQWWRDNYSSRPYARADRGFAFYEPGYRYWTDSATRYRGRSWNDAENDLRSGSDRYEHHGSNKSTWDEIKDSVKDAWDRVTGSDDATRHADATGRRTV